jgi:hypothetical protein
MQPSSEKIATAAQFNSRSEPNFLCSISPSGLQFPFGALGSMSESNTGEALSKILESSSHYATFERKDRTTKPYFYPEDSILI